MSSQEAGSFRVGHAGTQKNFSYCSLLLQTRTIMATVRDSHHYSNDLLQGGLEDHLNTFLFTAIPLAEACAVLTNSTLIEGNFLVYHFSLNTVGTPFNFPIVM